MSRKLDEKIAKMIGNVKASLAIEGLYVTDEENEVYKKYLKGDLTEKDVLKSFRPKKAGESRGGVETLCK